MIFKPETNGLWVVKVHFDAKALPAEAGGSVGRHLVAGAGDGECGATLLTAVRDIQTKPPFTSRLRDVGHLFIQVHDSDLFSATFDRALEELGSPEAALAACLWGNGAEPTTKPFDFKLVDNNWPETRVEALPEGRLHLEVKFSIDLPSYREHFDEGFSAASMRKNVIFHDGIEADAGFKIRGFRIDRKDHEATAFIDVEVLDGRALAALAAEARREAWCEDGWAPQTAGEALFELLLASNESASPDQYGAEYGDWNEKWIGDPRPARDLPKDQDPAPEPSC